MHRYKCFNAAMATTGATASVTTGTTIKTMLQINTPSTRQMTPVAWGWEIETVPATSVGIIELIQTDVAATVTAHVAAGVQPLVPGMPASQMTLGTANTGYTSTAEGSITATRLFDVCRVPATAGAVPLQYSYQFTKAEQMVVAVSSFLRVRALFAGGAVNMLTWIVWDE